MATRLDENNYPESVHSYDLKQQLRSASKTKQVDNQKFDSQAKPLAGNALLQNHTTVLLALMDSDILLSVDLADRVIIGRQDFETNEKADIDLMPYGGRDRGVSRRHAALYRTNHTVSLVDLNSTNGTYLNGVKLAADQPRLLREGDEVRFGSMRFHISFDG